MIAADQQPVFVVGTGRSGSTVFFDMFAKHPNVAWLSELSERYPDRLWLNSLLMRWRNNEVIDELTGKRFGPSEAYPFWERNCPGFSNPYRDLSGDDVTEAAAGRIREAVFRATNRKRYRFLAKITGWPRVRYLHRIFPEALFIEVTRSPFATACSLLEVAFWDGWRGPPNWRRGPLPPELDAIWQDEGQSFVALAALEYVIVQRAMALCRAALPVDRFHTVQYSQFCGDAVVVFRKALEFSRLEWTPRFENAIRRVPLSNRDDQWRRSLTEAQQAILTRTLERAEALPQVRG